MTQLHRRLSKSSLAYAANRAVAIVSSIWNWVAKSGEVVFADNPAKGVERFPGAQARALPDPRGSLHASATHCARQRRPGYLGRSTRLRADCEARPEAKTPHAHRRTRGGRDPPLDPGPGLAFREILHAKWEHVDLERGVIFLEDSKTGAKPYLPLRGCPRGSLVVKRIEGNPFIIPGAGGDAPRSDLKKPWAAVSRAAGLEGVRLHDLRHSFASFGSGASLGLPIIGKLLGNSQAATTHRYAHLDADPLRRASETIGSTIAAAMASQSNVIALPKSGAREKIP